MPNPDSTVAPTPVKAIRSGDYQIDTVQKVYNPRDHSIYKPAVIETCTKCGQPLPPKHHKITNEMNNYINEDGVEICMNSVDDVIVLKDIPYYRVTGRVGGKSVSEFLPKKPAFTPSTQKLEQTPLTDIDTTICTQPPVIPAPPISGAPALNSPAAPVTPAPATITPTLAATAPSIKPA